MMIIKKNKAVISAILAAALTVSAVMPVVSAGSRTKEEKYGDDTYAERFLSLYDDVITNGQENGYLSSKNVAQDGFGIPYHSVEELNIEAPDYGHETTSEAMSYIVWMAAMRDYISKDGKITNPDKTTTAVDSTSDLDKAWNTMEVMIPTIQSSGAGVSFMQKSLPSATYSEEWDDPQTYPTAMRTGNNGINPIHAKFTQVYSGDKGLYLMHWLADVDDWYGYGGGNNKFTFINTFQRGAQESCWETVPHPCVEELKYGMVGTRGLKGIFNTDQQVAKQYAYTNAPDAEDRAIQAIYAANRWGVGNEKLTKLAGKMGDQLRNNMFDKYYKKIGCQNESDQSNTYAGAHYLMSWYTSWGGTLEANQGDWTWQIGASHCHEFYQNPLAAYALLEDDGLNKAMLSGSDAVKDYETSLTRQLEFYLWLQSADCPIAGGATSSWHGRYLKYEYLDKVDDEYINKYGTNIPTTFYEMAYQEHPVYADPGSNHWIGNQVWAVQRLAEMYYYVKTEPTTVSSSIKIAGDMSIEQALEAILDRWVDWFVNNVKLYDDGTYAIPATLDWYGQPKSWTGSYDPNANSDLTCEVTAWGSSDLGCVSSLCNSLIHYAKTKGAVTEDAYNSANTTLAGKALYTAHELLDRGWKLGRDDIGLSIDETNGSMSRLFEQEVWVPNGQNGQPNYQGTMPNGDKIENGATFLSIRSQYLGSNGDGTNKDGTKSDNRGYVEQFKKAYDNVGANASAEEKKDAMESVTLNYHRFWHAGDVMLALGTMYDLFPEVEPDKASFTLDKEEITVAIGETDTITPSIDGCTFESADPTIATVDPSTGVVTGVAEGTTKITVTSPTGETQVCDVTVIPDTTGEKPTGTLGKDLLYGDVTLDGTVSASDVVALNKYLMMKTTYPLTSENDNQAYEQADCAWDGVLDMNDSMAIINFCIEVLTLDDLGPAR